MQAMPYRRIPLGPRTVVSETRADGTLLVRSTEPLAPYPRSMTDRLAQVAQRHPDRLFLAERMPGAPDSLRRWRELHYGPAWRQVERIAAALLARGLSQERPVAILSGSSLEHALLALGAQHAGVPHCAVTPAYCLLSDDHSKLRHVLDLLRPALVFVDDGCAFDRAIERCVPPDVEVVHVSRPSQTRASTPFEALLDVAPDDATRQACEAVPADSVAKVIFTSGSSGMPKGVIITQRMLACNQQMMVQSIPAIDDPLVTVSWLPWHHVSGGNLMLGMTILRAGTLYIDDGKPAPGEIDKTIANLREIAPTAYFSVPRGFALLIPYLRADAALREKFFSRLRLMYYSGAALGRSLVRELDELAVLACGERIPMISGYGATETAPAAVAANWLTDETGLAGLPIPGCELKLVPTGSGKYEARLRGPNVTPGYWGQPELSAALFDEEGFARLGDALSFVTPGDISQGLAFDGRISEDFKLSSGTFVGVGTLRARLVQEGDGLFLDAVVAGEGRDEVGAFIVGDRAACAAHCGLAPETPWEQVAAHPALRQRVQIALDAIARRATGSSTYIARAMVLIDGPSAQAGELTDKGSINARAFLANRPALLKRLYATATDPQVLIARLAG